MAKTKIHTYNRPVLLSGAALGLTRNAERKSFMKTSRWKKLAVTVVCCLAPVLVGPYAHGRDFGGKAEILKNARASYYSLRSRGLIGFQANVQPNWRLALTPKEGAPQGLEATLKILNGIHFSVAMDEAGAVKVTHELGVLYWDAGNVVRFF
jgi:hypothetical protein